MVAHADEKVHVRQPCGMGGAYSTWTPATKVEGGRYANWYMPANAA